MKDLIPLQNGESVWIVDIEESQKNYPTNSIWPKHLTNIKEENRRDLIPLANQETASSVDNPIPTPIEIPDETFITVLDENPSVVQTRSG